MHRKDLVSIWFFIGVLLLFYGVMILGSGLYDLATGVTGSTVLAELHAPVWWGALLIVIGGIYAWRFAPSKTR